MMSASSDSLNRLGKLRRRADGDGDTLTLSSGDIRRLVAKSARLSLDNLAVDRRNSGEPDTGPLTTSEEQQAARAVLFGDDDEVELRIREHVDRCNEEERMLAHKQQRWSRPPLYNFDDVPRFLRDHCFIRGG